MTNKYPIGSVWNTRGGKRAIVVKHEKRLIHVYVEGNIFCLSVDGTYYPVNGKPDSLDLIEPWRDPVVHECWINVYDNGFRYGTHESEYTALSLKTRLETIHIKYVDGKVTAEVVK